MKNKRNNILFIILSIFAIFVFFILGSLVCQIPHSLMIQNDLLSIRSAVQGYYQENGVFPQSKEELADFTRKHKGRNRLFCENLSYVVSNQVVIIEWHERRFGDIECRFSLTFNPVEDDENGGW